MSKTLVFIRHSHRDNTQRELDNGLSEKGQDQAKAIRRFFMDRFAAEKFDQGLWLVSNPADAESQLATNLRGYTPRLALFCTSSILQESD